MGATVLDSVSLGYQLIWNQLRQLSAIQLFVGGQNAARIDAAH